MFLLRKYIKNFFLILSLFFLITNNSYSIEPNEFVQNTVNEASEALNKNFTKEEKIKKLKAIAKKTVDIRGIGFYTLGKHRKSITDEQKKEYLELFESYFLKTFSDRLAEYTDPRIRVDSQKILNEKYTMVSSVLLASKDKPEIKIDWRVITKNPDKPLIIDVIIEGVSLAKVQREEFSSIIQNKDGGINALFINLKEFISKN